MVLLNFDCFLDCSGRLGVTADVDGEGAEALLADLDFEDELPDAPLLLLPPTKPPNLCKKK